LEVTSKTMSRTQLAVLGLFVLGSLRWSSSETRAQEIPIEPADVKESIVKISVTVRAPDFYNPWNKSNPSEAGGTGFIIDSNRILTNAHVVRYADQIYVQPNRSDEKFEANVIGISYGLDLALLQLENPDAISERKPLAMEESITPLRSEVNVFGYPIGGDQISITKGIVSRIEHTIIGGSQYGLRAQIDAAINPGNSGGPALCDGKVIGVAFSVANANSIGYLIHSTEVVGFLKDLEDGKYDGKPELFLAHQEVENPALRARLKIPKGVGGVYVSSLNESYSSEDFPLKVGDVITKIGPHAIDSQGNVKVQELTLSFLYYVASLTRDSKVPLTVWRDAAEIEIACPTAIKLDTVMQLLNGDYPRYCIIGPLAFEAASLDYIQNLTRGSLPWTVSLASRRSPLITRMQSPVVEAGEEVLMIPSAPFSHRLMKGYSPPVLNTIKSINGQSILNLVKLVEFFRDNQDEYIEIEFHETGSDRLIFNRVELLKSTEKILTDNNIRKQFSDDLEQAWNGGKPFQKAAD
jgi:S1-C subfamily serine protease